MGDGCSSLIVPAVAPGQDASSAKNASDEQAIGRLHDEWLKAYDAGDAETLDRIESDDFTVAGEFGERTKQQQLDGVRHRSEKSSAVARKFEQRQFRFYGDAALVTETDHAVAADGTSDFQTTELWTRHGSTWKVVHLHFSSLTKKP